MANNLGADVHRTFFLFENWFFNADLDTVVENIQLATMHGIAKQVNKLFPFKSISKKSHQKRNTETERKTLLVIVQKHSKNQ
jgi:hypothetical protein